MKIIILNTLFFLIAITAQAQLTDWQNISSKNFVTKIIHDQSFLYVGTKGGIVKIDKQSGEQTVLKRADGSMTSNSITDMAMHHGELWVGTEYNGLADGALIVDHVNTLSLAAMERLVEYANAGLCIILYGSDIKRVYGSDRAADVEVSEMYAQVADHHNVRVVATEEDILNVLQELGVSSHAKYHIPQLEATQYQDVRMVPTTIICTTTLFLTIQL